MKSTNRGIQFSYQKMKWNNFSIISHYTCVLYFPPIHTFRVSPFYSHGFPRCWNIILLAFASVSRKEEREKEGKRSGKVSNGTLGVLPATTPFFNSLNSFVSRCCLIVTECGNYRTPVIFLKKLEEATVYFVRQ